MTHKPMSAVAVRYFANGGPPSSPPIALLLRNSRMMIAIAASEQKIVTEKAKLKKIIEDGVSFNAAMTDRVTQDSRGSNSHDVQ